jgi:hypothetical protein
VHRESDEHDTARSGRPARAAASRAPTILDAKAVAALLSEEPIATPVPQQSITQAELSIAHETSLIRAHRVKSFSPPSDVLI